MKVPNKAVDLDAKIDAFKQKMSDTMNSMVTKMARKYIPVEYKNKPKVCTAKQAAQYMVGRKKITILTGAGISAASGIPTFRG